MIYRFLVFMSVLGTQQALTKCLLTATESLLTPKKLLNNGNNKSPEYPKIC